MKKITLMVAVVAMFFAANAQDEFLSKRGMPILPEAGEYSIGINATPFLQYAGNIFNGNMGNAAPAFGWTAANPMQITGKYMVDEHTAYRAVFRLGFTSDKQRGIVIQDGQTSPDPSVTVEDSWKNSQMNVGIGAGLEKRRGNGRLQGIYGAMAMITFETEKDSYEYGNAFSATNSSATVWDYASGTATTTSVRSLEEKQGTTIGFQAYAFVGAEYFFAPKLSISGEFMYGLGFESEGDGTTNTEYYGNAPGATAPAVNTIETSTGGNSSFGFDTGISATLNLNFYF